MNFDFSLGVLTTYFWLTKLIDFEVWGPSSSSDDTEFTEITHESFLGEATGKGLRNPVSFSKGEEGTTFVVSNRLIFLLEAWSYYCLISSGWAIKD